MITITTVIMIITIINHNNHNNWNPHIHKIIIPSSPLHTTNCSPQLPCLEWRHCDLLANETGTCFSGPQSLKENPQGWFFSPFGGVFFCSKFLLVPKKTWCVFFSEKKMLEVEGDEVPNSKLWICWKFPLEFPGVMYKSPPSLRGKNKSWVFSREFMGPFRGL